MKIKLLVPFPFVCLFFFSILNSFLSKPITPSSHPSNYRLWSREEQKNEKKKKKPPTNFRKTNYLYMLNVIARRDRIQDHSRAFRSIHALCREICHIWKTINQNQGQNGGVETRGHSLIVPKMRYYMDLNHEPSQYNRATLCLSHVDEFDWFKDLAFMVGISICWGSNEDNSSSLTNTWGITMWTALSLSARLVLL